MRNLRVMEDMLLHRFGTKLRLAAFTLIIAFYLYSVARADEILVAAAASLSDVLQEIGSAYRANHAHTLRFTFGSSSTLARQIEEGAPADLFFSADTVQIDRLEKRGLLEPRTRANLVSNQLVIVVPVDSRIVITSAKDLLKSEVKRIALAEPSSVPVGVYSSKYLQQQGLWDRIKVKVIPVLDVRAALASVQSGNVDAGFVYRTDAALSTKVRVAYKVPRDDAPAITYPAAIIRASKEKQIARDFLNFVTSPYGRETFIKYGFIPLN